MRRAIRDAPELPIDGRRIEEFIQVCRHHNVFPVFLGHHYPAASLFQVSGLFDDALDSGRFPHLIISVVGGGTFTGSGLLAS